MTDKKRDESRDIGYNDNTAIGTRWDVAKDYNGAFERFVPHSDFVAAEAVAKRAVKLLNMVDRGHPDVAVFIESLTARYFE